MYLTFKIGGMRVLLSLETVHSVVYISIFHFASSPSTCIHLLVTETNHNYHQALCVLNVFDHLTSYQKYRHAYF